MIIEHLSKIDSTNEYIKKYIKKRKDALVRADFQTAGKGTKGRSFISEKGGLYLSKLTFHDGLKAQDSWSIMVDAAMAVVKALLAFNVTPQIKWPNDILVDGKKICGILIQNAFRGEMVDYSLVGIGINVNNDIADEIKDIAISLKQKLGKDIDIESFSLTFMLNYSSGCSVEEYKQFSAVIGKRVTVIRGEESFEAVVEDVLSNGALKLTNGELLYAGELNLKVKI